MRMWFQRTGKNEEAGSRRRSKTRQQGTVWNKVWGADRRPRRFHLEQFPVGYQAVSVPELAVGPGGDPLRSPGILILFYGVMMSRGRETVAAELKGGRAQRSLPPVIQQSISWEKGKRAT